MNKLLLLFGIVLLVIGLIAALYEKVETMYIPYYGNISYSRGYPYQTIGIILIVAGIGLAALSFFYTGRKTVTVETAQPINEEKPSS